MKNKGIFKIITGITKWILTVFLLLILIVVIVQKVTKNNFAIGGFRIFTIVSESMVPDYQIGDILVSKEIESSLIQIGDRITYLGKSGDFTGLVVTHEVIEKRNEDEVNYFVTKGTANEIADPEINENQIYGKVIYKTKIFSFIGRMMTNIIIYYILFVITGVYISYQIITIFFLKNNEEEVEVVDKID